MRKPVEPLLWSLFGAGGALAALVMPVLICILALVFPMGWAEARDYDFWARLLSPLISRLCLAVVICVSLFHWAHRFRFTLYDGLQLQHFDSLISLVCYGSAFALSVYTCLVLLAA